MMILTQDEFEEVRNKALVGFASLASSQAIHWKWGLNPGPKMKAKLHFLYAYAIALWDSAEGSVNYITESQFMKIVGKSTPQGIGTYVSEKQCIPVLGLSVGDTGVCECSCDDSATELPNCVAPSITEQPQDQSVQEPSDPSQIVVVSFQVHVAGTEPFTYQWKKNGVAIPGQTSAQLQLTANTDNNGQYSYTVTNPCGTIESSQATLNVVPEGSLINVSIWSGDTDPTGDLTAGNDALPYQHTTSVASNVTSVVLDFTAQSNSGNKFRVVKLSSIIGPNKDYFNRYENGIIAGPIPDASWKTSILVGGVVYFISNDAITLDPNSTTTFKHI